MSIVYTYTTRSFLYIYPHPHLNFLISIQNYTMDTNHKHLQLLTLLVLVLIFSPAAYGQAGTVNDPRYPARFSPAMAVIIVVLVAALFFMAFFSIYIRRCSDNSTGTVRLNLSMRRRAAAATRGLEKELIETFPTFPYSEVKGLKIGKGALECAVCLNEFEEEETLRLIPKCDHVFHPECIDAWLESHVTCPVCRANLVPEQGEDLTVVEGENTDAENHENGDVIVPISEDIETDRPNTTTVEESLPEVIERSSSVKQNQNRPPRSRSVRPRLFEKFRSHSTGHSVVQAGENVDRFTLRLPEDVRRRVMKRALLNRTASSIVVRGYRAGEGSSRGKSFRRLESLEEPVKSERWGFSRVPSFLTRAFSMRTQKVAAANGEASTSSMMPKGVVPSDKSPTNGDVTESTRPPV